MSDLKCFNCEKDDPEHTYRFVRISVNVVEDSVRKGNVETTATRTVEKFDGVERASVCNTCVKKKRRAGKILGAVVGFLIVILMFLLAIPVLQTVPDDTIAAVLISALVIGLGLGIFMFILIGRTSKVQFILARMLERKTTGDDNSSFDRDRKTGTSTYKEISYRFLPVDPELYTPKGSSGPTLECFRKNTGLRTDIYKAVYEMFIASGNGNSFVDEILEKKLNPEDVISYPKET